MTKRIQLLTVEEVCDILRVCRMTLYRMGQRKLLKPVPINGRSIRYRLSDVERFIDQARRQRSR